MSAREAPRPTTWCEHDGYFLCSALGSGLGGYPVLIESDSCDEVDPISSSKRRRNPPAIVKVEKRPEHRDKRRDLDTGGSSGSRVITLLRLWAIRGMIR